MVRQFVKGARAFCFETSENNIQRLNIGSEYIIIEENHIIDGEEYIVVEEYIKPGWHIRAKAEYFA